MTCEIKQVYKLVFLVDLFVCFLLTLKILVDISSVNITMEVLIKVGMVYPNLVKTVKVVHVVNLVNIWYEIGC